MKIDLDQYRADFKRVWQHARDTGLISADELRTGYAEASADVRERMGDPEFLESAARECRISVEAIEADHARAERIRAERRAEKAGGVA